MKARFVLSSALSAIVCLASASAFASDDLQLPGEKWLAKFDKFACSQGQTTPTARPEALEALDVRFSQITSDSTLDNVLLRATFTENGASCRYSALLLADNATNDVSLVQSKAFAEAGEAACENGRRLLDESLTATTYWYYGRPHRVALLLPVGDAQALCGEGVGSVAAEFVVSGRISQPAQ